MQAGKLRHRIIIQSVTLVDDAVGQPQETWTTHATVWSHIEPLRGREYWDAQQAQSEATHRITIRRLDTLLPTMRVNYEGRIFAIDSILHPSESETHLLAVEALG